MTQKNKATVEAQRTIVCAGRNPQALARIHYDVVLRQLASDPNIRIRYALMGDSDYAKGAEQLAKEANVKLMSWDEIKADPPDLIISASPCLEMYEPGCPVGLLPHGAGHGRLVPYRKGAGGTSPDQIRAEDGTLPAFMQVSGQDSLDQLALDTPEALGIAHLNGDVCYERLQASGPWIADYRHALGVEDHQKLVVITSTWDQESLLATHYKLLERLLLQLPAQEFRVAYIPHPNIDNHPAAPDMEQVLALLRCRGLIMVPPSEGWRALLLAADCVVGDHGSVTVYAVALGKPVLLAAFGSSQMRPGSALAKLGEAAPEFDCNVEDPAPQIREAKPVDFDVTPIVACPEGTGPLDRFCSLVYKVLGLAPRVEPVEPERLPLPELLEDVHMTAYRCHPDLETDAATWPRFIDSGRRSVPRAPSEPSSGGYRVVDMKSKHQREIAAAEVLTHSESDPKAMLSRSEASRRVTRYFAENILATVVSIRVDRDEALIGIKDGPRFFVRSEWTQLLMLPSALCAWLVKHAGKALGLDLVAEALVDLRRCFKTPLTLYSAEHYA